MKDPPSLLPRPTGVTLHPLEMPAPSPTSTAITCAPSSSPSKTWQRQGVASSPADLSRKLSRNGRWSGPLIPCAEVPSRLRTGLVSDDRDGAAIKLW